MSKWNILLLTSVLVASACTNARRATTEQPGAPKPGQQASEKNGTVPIVLDEQALKSKYALDTANLSYKFNYLSSSRADKVVFTAGKASLTFSNLENGKAGDLTLEVLESNVSKLKGVIKNLTLKPGQNLVQMTLSPTAGASGAIGDLTIDVTIEGSVGGNGGNGGGGGGGGGGGSGGNNGGATLPTNPNPSAVSWARDVKPLTERYCAECHHAGKALNLVDYPGANNGATIDKVLAAATDGTMPPSPRDKMPADAVEKIRKWKAEGLNP